jgi:hypothetical protein
MSTRKPVGSTTVTPEQVQALLDSVGKVKTDQDTATAATAASHEADTAVSQAQAAVSGAQALASQRKLEEAAADAKVNTDLAELQALVNALVVPAPGPEPTP